MKYLLILLFLALSVPLVAQNPLVGRSIRLTGEFTASSLSTDQDDYALDPGYRIYYISASTPVTVSGIIAMGAGAEITIQNTSSNAITFTHEDTGSSAGNRINISGGQVILGQLGIMNLRYNASTSRWIVLSTTVSIIESVPEPTIQADNMVVFNITTTTASFVWTRGNGQFAVGWIYTAVGGGDVVDNISYAADLNYGDGDLITGATTGYTVFNGTGNAIPGETVEPITVTGLTAGTNYNIIVKEYNQSGGSINYLLTTNGHEGFNTNASVSTPTAQYSLSSILTKETEIDIEGERGDGDSVMVIMSYRKQVTNYPQDDLAYDDGPFGFGSDLGDGDFVVFKGTTANFTLTGFQRDEKYSRPVIIEYSDLKYLLPQ